jgi:hypothetical protein
VLPFDGEGGGGGEGGGAQARPCTIRTRTIPSTSISQPGRAQARLYPKHTPSGSTSWHRDGSSSAGGGEKEGGRRVEEAVMYQCALGRRGRGPDRAPLPSGHLLSGGAPCSVAKGRVSLTHRSAQGIASVRAVSATARPSVPSVPASFRLLRATPSNFSRSGRSSSRTTSGFTEVTTTPSMSGSVMSGSCPLVLGQVPSLKSVSV